eukprot:TRINITY_DN10741_c0_g1_i1.p2 TRINITY_DN10741_c0_g1~~TRINITY_DN10741_c0_g1_i1.p2  ORF type:complete len:145 (+),score=52.06 TRINITY_DN10741_c0_g1_i1:297-731(+)
MPFLLGVLASNMPVLVKMKQELEEVIIFDIDSNQRINLNEDVELPDWSYRDVLPQAAGALRRRLNNIHKRSAVANARTTDLAIAQTFLEFFYFIFGAYQDFFLVDGSFDRDGFYRQRPKDVLKDPTIGKERKARGSPATSAIHP